MRDTMPSDSTLDEGGPTSDGRPAVVGAVIASRYRIVREIGRGAMGVVFEAHDLLLDRQVAIKRLERGGNLATLRFSDEAHVTARLQHPAIVPIHEFGRWSDGRPFYVMKLVSGRTLAASIDETTTLEERMALLGHVVSVSEAIAYAHRNRVIHRDLKPGNVIIGEFGETVVIDWGLAKSLEQERDSGTRLPPTLDSTALGRNGFTVEGTIVGTPAYMPPEQAEGRSVDERADVYALGAMLYHVLAGVPPYAGRSALAICTAVIEGPPPALVQRVPRVPLELAAIVHKAMSYAAEDRYPSGEAMAADLRRYTTGQLVRAHHYTPTQRVARFVRRHRIASSVVATSVLASAIGGALASRLSHGTIDPCPAEGDVLTDVWTSRHAGRLSEVFVATGVGFADDIAQRTTAELDAYAASWREMLLDACRATRVRGEQSELRLEKQTRCLSRRRAELRAAVDGLMQVDPETVARAMEVTGALVPVERCDDDAFLDAASEPPADPERARAIEAVMRELDELAVLRELGRSAEVLERAGPVIERAERTGDAPLLAQANAARARAQWEAGDVVAAKRELEAVYLSARSSRLFDVAVDAAMALASAHSEVDPDLGLARLWLGLAEAEITGGGLEHRRFDLLQTTRLVLDREGRIPEALEVAEHLVELAQASCPEGCRDLADAYTELAAEHARVSAWERVVEYADLAWRHDAEYFGPLHPTTCEARTFLADGLANLGRLEEALEHRRALVEVYERTFAPDHPLLALALSRLGESLIDAKRYEEAIVHIRRALGMLERVQSAQTPAVLNLLALAYDYLHRYDESAAAYRQVLAHLERMYPEGHISTVAVLGNLGRLHADQGRDAEAVEIYRRAIEMRRKLDVPPDHAFAMVLTSHGLACYRLGRYDESESALREVVTLTEDGVLTRPGSTARSYLSRLVWPRDRAAARALVRNVAQRCSELTEEQRNYTGCTWATDWNGPPPSPRRRAQTKP